MLQQKTSEGPVISQPAPKRAAEAIDFSKWGPVTLKPVTALRGKISEKMVESWTTIPHVTQFDEADITDLMALLKKVNPEFEKQGTKLTLTVFAIKAATLALKKYPIFNSSLDELRNEIVFKDYYSLGIAVDTEQGLIVPVLRDVDKKGLLELQKELNELAEKTRQRKVGIEELKGGTFTISNQGGIGGAHFTPIINKPEVAILGLGRGALKPAVRGEQIVPRVLLPVALSYDHRVIDGAQAARFIRELIQTLEAFKEEDLQNQTRKKGK
jgi:pyruvate dehydrogenase E2 component (dihydrolipoamide acetyltransferase)